MGISERHQGVSHSLQKDPSYVTYHTQIRAVATTTLKQKHKDSQRQQTTQKIAKRFVCTSNAAIPVHLHVLFTAIQSAKCFYIQWQFSYSNSVIAIELSLQGTFLASTTQQSCSPSGRGQTSTSGAHR